MASAGIYNSPLDLASWCIGAKITSVQFTNNAFLVDFDRRDGPNRWPDYVTPGWAGPVPIVEEAPGVFSYRTPAPEFALWRLEVDHEPAAVPANGRGRIVLSAGGSITLSGAGSSLPLAQGQSAFVLPDEEVTVTGPGSVFVGAAGLGPA